jgi:outer membrane protein assembly factor BamA
VPCRCVLAALAILVLAAPSVLAQSSRAEQIALLQADKAARLHPYQPPLGERVMIRLEDFFQGVEPSGPYPWIGSVYPGGFLGIGAGYRTVFADTASFNVLGGWSLRNYRLLHAELKSPVMADGRLRAAAHFTRLHADAVNFYGIGNDTRRANRRRYEYDPTTIGGNASWQLTPWFALGGGLDYLDSRATLRVDDEPRQDVQYTVARASAAIDWRDSPGYSRRGGLYKLETTNYAARHGDPLSFRRTDAEVVQLWPILRAQWVIAVRGLVTTTHTGADDTVPYFMLPSLGGASSLRGFRSWRFRDRHRLLLSGEYRWTPGELLDMALFYDTGKVAPRIGDLDLRGLHHDYGISLRIHSPTFTGLRADLARSREGWVFRLGSGTAF